MFSAMKLESSKWNGCPIRYSAEIIADKWTFIILRDFMFRGKYSYKELLNSTEKISTNILAARLKKLEQHGILDKTQDPESKKQFIYELTEKGRDLMPVMLGLFEWSYKHDESSYVSDALVREIEERPESMAEDFRAGRVLILPDSEDKLI